MKKRVIGLLATAMFVKGSLLAEGSLALLIDTSGSMKHKVEEIKRVSKMVLNKQKDCDIYFFNDTIQKVDSNHISTLTPRGGTNFTLAFKKFLNQKDKPKAIVVITDGSPDHPDRALKIAKKLKKDGVVICSAYVGSGNKPSVLQAISDVSIIEDSMQASLDSCLNSAKVKEVIPFTFEEEIENELHFFTPATSASMDNNQDKKQIVSNGKKAIIILFDGSGENYSCDEIRESNFKKVASMLTKDRLKKQKVSDIIFGIFSRDTTFVSIASAEKRRTDSAKYSGLAKKAKVAISSIKNRVQDYYKTIINGKNKHLGKDIEGAIKKSLSVLNEQESKKGRYDSVEIVLASDMVQSINKKSVQKRLRERHIQLPSNVTLTILGKALSCEKRYTQAQKENFFTEIETFWKSVIDSDRIQFYRNY